MSPRAVLPSAAGRPAAAGGSQSVVPAPLERSIAQRTPWLAHIGLAAILLAFIPITAPVDPLGGDGYSPRGVIEIGLIFFGILAILTLRSVRRSIKSAFSQRGFLILTAYCAWCLMTAIWSPAPFLTFSKSVELWLIGVGALAVVLAYGPNAAARGAYRNAIPLVLLAVILFLLAINPLIHGRYLPQTGGARNRFMLAWAHPLVAADLFAAAIICIAASRFNVLWRLLLIPPLLYLVKFEDARGPEIGLVLALAAMTVASFPKGFRLIVAMAGIALLVTAAMLFPDVVAQHTPRDMETLDGRTDVWAYAFNLIKKQPIQGYGYYASRYQLMPAFPWAGHAHNSFVEAQLSTGIIGMIILAAFTAYVFYRIYRGGGVLMLGMVTYGYVHGFLNPLIFYPTMTMFMILIFLSLSEEAAGPAPRQAGASRIPAPRPIEPRPRRRIRQETLVRKPE